MPTTGASAITFVVRRLSTDLEIVEPMIQPPGFRWGIHDRKKEAGWSMCSMTSKRVRMSALLSSSVVVEEEGGMGIGRSSMAQLR